MTSLTQNLLDKNDVLNPTTQEAFESFNNGNEDWLEP